MLNTRISEKLRLRGGLNSIFPWPLVLLILFPSLAGLLINPYLVDFRNVLISLVWLSLLTIPAVLFRKKVFYTLAFIFSFVDGFFNLGHWLLVKAPLSAAGLFVLFNTNFEEAIDFLSFKSSFWYLIMLPYLMLFVIALKYNPLKAQRNPNAILIGLVALLSVVFIAENAVQGRLIRKGSPVLVKAVISFYQESLLYRQLEKEVHLFRGSFQAKPIQTDSPQLYVLIIGESANRNHLSLYGYHRPTTPLAEQSEDLLAFKNVISPYSNTMNAITAALSSATLENQQKTAESIQLIHVFQQAGFSTWWLSNQSPIGVWDNLVGLMARQSDRYLFINVAASTSFESLYQVAYDENLFQPYATVLAENTKDKFIVLHLMGSHSLYAKRFPDRFRKFVDNSSKKSTMIAAYDNSILYTDFVVDSLLKITKAYCAENNTVCSVIYFSDHGENVYDESNYAGHDYAGYIPRSNVEIPFMLWCSPAYRSTFPEKYRLMFQRLNLPFMTDDLFHAILDLSGIETDVCEVERSLFNENYKSKKRIMEDGNDYDEL